MADTPALIALRHVSKSYDGGRSFAIRAVELSVPERAFLSVVGDSGSGKTTLLKTINRLIEPDEGSVLIGDRLVKSVPPHALRRQIGYVFQSIGLFPHMTVAENIGITPRLLGWPDPEVRVRTLELIDLIGLPRAYLQRWPTELSGGQQQRVGIARALAARPAIMLMDEPFGALDPVTRDALGSEYRRLHEQLSLTTLMVTHDVMEAVLLSERIVVMRQGTIIADDAPRALLADHADPGVRALMDMPRRQAERLQALSQGRSPGG